MMTPPQGPQRIRARRPLGVASAVLFGLLALPSGQAAPPPAPTPVQPPLYLPPRSGIPTTPVTGAPAVPCPPPVGLSGLAPVPVCPPANAGMPERLATPPQKTPRPATGPGSIAEFVEGLTQNDAGFEVIVSQGRILTTRVDLGARGKSSALVAVGDPTIADFAIISSRQIRVEGRRIGVTDLSIVTPDNQTYSFEIRVVADLHVLRAQLHCLFPDATLRLTQIRDHVVVEGEARDAAQVARITETIRAYLLSVQTAQARRMSGQQGAGRSGATPEQAPPPRTEGQPPGTPENPSAPATASPEQPAIRSAQGTIAPPRVINLIRVPGSKQVLLKVRVAELNRTAFRQIGADVLATKTSSGAILGTQIGGAGTSAGASVASGVLSGFASLLTSGATTGFGIFGQGDFAILLSALRRNSILKILAEPNLVALNGHTANFLAGGEFPVPVPQTGGGGISPTITVQFKEFGVRLGFLPVILDRDVIRLQVDPEVSALDTTIGTVLVPGGSPVPGLSTRRAHTVVEMREGQTLAIAGLLQLTMDGTTQRIPGLGDLPVLGPFFSNTTHNRIEKELIVLVTPYLVEPMCHDQVPPTPGDEVKAPTDLEFYLLKRIEGRTGRDFRSTTRYESQLPVVRALLKLDAANVRGPYGYCE